MPQDTIHAHAVVDPNAVYSLGSSPGESQRLKRQADELALESETLLDRVRLRPGDSAIDLGCGPRGIIELLHDRVSPRGRVVGLDSDPAHVAMASELVASAGLDDVEVVQADARCTALPAGSFDLVHARTLLATVPQPMQVLAEMVRLTRPGGWVASLEPDAEHSIYYPHHKAFDRLRELFVVAFPRNGADPLIGRRLGQLYRLAGLEDVGLEARAAVYPPGHSRRTIAADLLRAMRPQLLALGAADEAELDSLDAAIRKHLDDPDLVVMPNLMFLAWGRKPSVR
ncbi:MAG: methyltransferase domain-containing protein [Solirubrobacterales bacterium]|nr:methyltransferase domain-containing protein [Solirubrobacterales bacterium]